ncbi:hypothetical protein PFISCL1PPCAC_4398 [Pristionchus fissidentatus]|uniref:Uncharacterized protein n=1 Tax=Pristionchus fissidentatus TaxID=1538716 RepID=A0AAV5V2Z2_9BILA|nr:hypothetical protein PFISCL1PPCAC_4398 [Pristionchus fissidentatus]
MLEHLEELGAAVATLGAENDRILVTKMRWMKSLDVRVQCAQGEEEHRAVWTTDLSFQLVRSHREGEITVEFLRVISELSLVHRSIIALGEGTLGRRPVSEDIRVLLPLLQQVHTDWTRQTVAFHLHAVPRPPAQARQDTLRSFVGIVENSLSRLPFLILCGSRLNLSINKFNF